jgi:hypothetical protein
MTAGKTWIDEFPGNFVWSNATLVTKGMAPYGRRGSRKHLKIFTRADGSTYHAQADNRQVGVDYIADWIGGTLQATSWRGGSH